MRLMMGKYDTEDSAKAAKKQVRGRGERQIKEVERERGSE